MKINVPIRPTVYTGQGTYESAMNRFHSVTPLVCATYSGYGNYYGTFKSKGDSGPDYAYCFNVDVSSREASIAKTSTTLSTSTRLTSDCSTSWV